MNDHSRPAGIPPIGHIAKINAHGYGANGLYLWFSEMKQYEWYHLDQYAGFFELVLEAKQQVTAE